MNISECLNVNAANGCRPWMALAPGAIIGYCLSISRFDW